jgi:hypothetical protein
MRSLTLADYGPILTRHLPRALVDPAAHRALRKSFATLPPMSGACYEIRLTLGDRSADFFVAGRPSMFLTPHADAVLPASSEWHLIRDLCHHWSAAAPGSLVRMGIRSVIVEFDAARARTPGVVFLDGLSGLLRRHSLPEVLSALLPLLTGSQYPQSRLEVLTERLGTLSPTAHLNALGYPLGRATDSLRVHAVAVSARALAATLRRLRWPGPAERVQNTVLACLRGDLVSLNFDLGADVGPRLGIECSVADRYVAGAWASLLDRLVEAGLCTGTKRDAMLAWSGVSSPATDADVWPENLQQLAEHLGSPEAVYFRRYINHVKLSFVGDDILGAKAYLVCRLSLAPALDGAPPRDRQAPPAGTAHQFPPGSHDRLERERGFDHGKTSNIREKRT